MAGVCRGVSSVHGAQCHLCLVAECVLGCLPAEIYTRSSTSGFFPINGRAPTSHGQFRPCTCALDWGSSVCWHCPCEGHTCMQTPSCPEHRASCGTLGSSNFQLCSLGCICPWSPRLAPSCVPRPPGEQHRVLLCSLPAQALIIYYAAFLHVEEEGDKGEYCHAHSSLGSSACSLGDPCASLLGSE